MTVFVLAAATLCLLAAALMTRSLWRPARPAAGDKAGESGVAGDLPPKASPALAAVLALFAFVVAGGGYALLGAPDHLSLGPHSSAQRAAEASQQPESPEDLAARKEALVKINAMIDKVAAHLKEKPDDADGWQLLARTYATIGQQAQAVDAFKKALALRPNDSTLLSDYAVALAVANNRKLEGEPMQLIERALKADPKNPKALALAGTAAFGRKDYKGAVGYWEDLAKIEPASTPFGEQIRGSIAQARELAGMPPPVATADATGPSKTDAAPSGAAKVSGVVTLAESLKGKASPDDTVFIFARAVEGPRMPLAIIRKQVKDLPVQFTLDDSMAMSPAAKLSGVAQVVVGARISTSGNAIPQAGDLQGLVTGVPVGAADVKVEISEQIAR